MAQVVPFPARVPIRCGRIDELPCHVWDEQAEAGDLCDCGQSVLPPRRELVLPPTSFEISESVESV